MESDYLPEKFVSSVAIRVIGEVSVIGTASVKRLAPSEYVKFKVDSRPGKDRDQSNADDDCALDSKGHQKSHENSTKCYTNPELMKVSQYSQHGG